MEPFKFRTGDILTIVTNPDNDKSGWRVVHVDYNERVFYIIYCRDHKGNPATATNPSTLNNGIKYSEKHSFSKTHLKLSQMQDRVNDFEF